MRKKIFFYIFIFLCACQYNSIAQTKFKAGLGYNFITNNFAEEHLEPYTAPSIHFSYTFFKRYRISAALESATSYKRKENETEIFSGFVSSLPVIIQADLKKILLYAGAGPAYLRQHQHSFQYKETVSAYFLNYTAGFAIKGNTFLADVLYPEYNFRISYYDDFYGTKNDAGAISLIVFLRATR